MVTLFWLVGRCDDPTVRLITVVVVVLVVAGCGVSRGPSAQPMVGPATSFGDGTFVVGEEIVPGRYRTAGPAAWAPGCYWARLRGTSGEFRDIIANGIGQGPVTVTISRSDAAFKSGGCAGWVRTG